MVADPRCAAGDGCVGGTSDGAARVATNPMCPACVQAIQKDYDDIYKYVRVLTALYGGWHPQSDWRDKVSSSSTPQAPSNLVVFDLLNAMYKAHDDVDTLIINLVSLPGGVAKALEVRRVVLKAKDMCGLERVWCQRYVPCPECGLQNLGTYIGEDYVECTTDGCDAHLLLDEYDEWCLELSFLQQRKGRRENR